MSSFIERGTAKVTGKWTLKKCWLFVIAFVSLETTSRRHGRQDLKKIKNTDFSCSKCTYEKREIQNDAMLLIGTDKVMRTILKNGVR